MMYSALEGRRSFAGSLPPPLRGWIEKGDAPVQGFTPLAIDRRPSGAIANCQTETWQRKNNVFVFSVLISSVISVPLWFVLLLNETETLPRQDVIVCTPDPGGSRLSSTGAERVIE